MFVAAALAYPAPPLFIVERLLSEKKLVCLSPEAFTREYFVKKVFLKISELSKENTCVGVSF